MRRVYLSGPMTGLTEYNYPAFHEAASRLRMLGFEVVNPAEKELPAGEDWSRHMRLDIAAMMDCDGIVMLPGWEQSKGARIERRLMADLGMPVADFETVVRFQLSPRVACPQCQQQLLEATAW